MITADTIKVNAKNRVLVITDHQSIMTSIVSRFFDCGWLIDALTTQSWMARNSLLARNYEAIAFVIDADFRRRFGSIIHEMGAMIRNSSAHAPVYLLCEDGYESCFSPWLEHIKQVLEFEADEKSLHYSIDYIINIKSFAVGGLCALPHSHNQQMSTSL